MGKLITHVALFRAGVREFEERVNKHLAYGWNIQSVTIDKRGFRIVCYAHLWKKYEEETK